MRPLLLDLFCGAGGSAVGYHRAGFDVVGVDIESQPRYPFEFIEGDALEVAPYLIAELKPDAIHASPPCQAYSRVTREHARHPDLIPPTREMLEASGRPYVIENVEGAPLVGYLRLCGSMFGLQVQRHRYFELSFPSWSPGGCNHKAWERGRAVTVTGHFGTNGGSPSHSLEPFGLADARRVMGIDWMSRTELVEAIPPAYCEWIGSQLLAHLRTPLLAEEPNRWEREQ